MTQIAIWPSEMSRRRTLLQHFGGFWLIPGVSVTLVGEPIDEGAVVFPCRRSLSFKTVVIVRHIRPSNM